MRHRHERNVDGEQKQEDDGEHRPREVLEHALDGAAKREDEHDEENQPGRDPGLRRLVGRARHAPHPGAEQRRRRAASERRPSELKESDHGVKGRPELGPGLEPHDAAVDRLAGVERVANRLEVEEDLQQDGNRRDQENRRRILDRGGRADEPFAAANRRRGHDRAWPDDLEEVARAKGRRRRQIGNIPARELAVTGRQGVDGWGAVHGHRRYHCSLVTRHRDRSQPHRHIDGPDRRWPRCHGLTRRPDGGRRTTTRVVE